MEANGVVEKPDVVGAIFGQTEGLLGPDLDLRELQMTGRVGRIEVDVSSSDGASRGEITIPSSLNSTETALVAASLETIDRVGPCSAEIEVESVDDVRVSKRDFIIERAKEILEDMQEVVPESEEISKRIKQEVRTSEISYYRGLPVGPELPEADSVILCEGRADVMNLLQHGVKNGVGIGGTSVPGEITDIASGKEITVFLDGDRGGDLIKKELDQMIDIDYVARAPDGKEVEDLTKKEIYQALRDKRPHEEPESTETQKAQSEPETDESVVDTDDLDLEEEQRTIVLQTLERLVGTRAVYVLDEDLQVVSKAPLTDFESALEKAASVYMVLLDGEVNDVRASLAADAGADYVVGMSVSGVSNEETLCVAKEDLAA
ncbi:MAG: DNA primase DnaG [Candidatus Nanohaloarchaeota archaeon QJJ-5]|nr:DNA primase DnaG [Candidatus Nanohaloarchaeota archaeon QJJ-5]